MAKRSRKSGPDPIDVYVGSRVRNRRVELHMSQGKLGETIGVTFQQIQKYENGTNRIGASNLYRITKSLGVDNKYMYEGIPEELTKKPLPRGLSESAGASFDQDILNSKEAIEILHNYVRIENTQVRRQLSRFVKSLAEAYRTGGKR